MNERHFFETDPNEGLRPIRFENAKSILKKFINSKKVGNEDSFEISNDALIDTLELTKMKPPVTQNELDDIVMPLGFAEKTANGYKFSELDKNLNTKAVQERYYEIFQQNPDEQFTMQDITDIMGKTNATTTSHGSSRTYILQLESEGLIKVTKTIGKEKYYQLNKGE